MSRIAKVDVSEWDPELRDMTHADKATSVERGGLNILAHRPEIAKGSMVAGLTPTAGGVVFTGTTEGDFLALDAKSGEVLYRFNTGGAIAGAPSTYLAG
jgi:glucose dehydrogenase